MDTGRMLKVARLVVRGSMGAVYLFRGIRRNRTSPDRDASGWPSPLQCAIGLVTNFFDTLSTGSFATTTTAFKLLCLVRDGFIPGTMPTTNRRNLCC